jgi:hypothetical protein
MRHDSLRTAKMSMMVLCVLKHLFVNLKVHTNVSEKPTYLSTYKFKLRYYPEDLLS